MHDSDEPNPFAPAPGTEQRLAHDGAPVEFAIQPMLACGAQLVLNDPQAMAPAFLLTALPAVVDGFVHQALVGIAELIDIPLVTTLTHTVGLGVHVIGAALTTFLAVGLMRMCLLTLHGQPVHLNQLLEERETALHGAMAAAIVGFGVFVGIGIFIVPGVFFGVATCLTLPILVDRGLAPLDAVKASWAMTEGHRDTLFLLGAAVAVAGFFLASSAGGALFALVVPIYVVLSAVAYQAIGYRRFLEGDEA